MLARYKKQGGFEQLLNLVETSNPKKQETFLKLIEQESRPTVDMIKEKMLSCDKIFSWEQSFLIEITTQVPMKVLAICLHGRPLEIVNKAIATFTHMQKQEMHAMLNDKKPTPGEIEAANMKLIQTVRGLNKAKVIRLEKIDPKLDFPADQKVA